MTRKMSWHVEPLLLFVEVGHMPHHQCTLVELVSGVNKFFFYKIPTALLPIHRRGETIILLSNKTLVNVYFLWIFAWQNVLKCSVQSAELGTRLRSRDMFTFVVYVDWRGLKSENDVANATITERNCKAGYIHLLWPYFNSYVRLLTMGF